MSSDSTPRPKAHEIDTLAMRQVAQLLPSEWVERRVDNDYGIDLEVELFRRGRTEGNLLFLQVKGIERDQNYDYEWRFVMKVNGLEYAEMFTVPVILVAKPVYDNIHQMRFLWLQEYIRVVLDHDKPTWRSQQTVTVRLPAGNNFPNEINLHRWRFIAGAPKRARELGRLAFFAHEFEVYRERFQLDPGELDHLKTLDSILDEVRTLATLFSNDGGWAYTRFLAQTAISGPHDLIKQVLAGETIDLEETGRAEILESIGVDDDWIREAYIHAQLFAAGNQMSAIVATANDFHLPRTLWLSTGDHLF